MEPPEILPPSAAKASRFSMINVGPKPITFRQAWAEGSIVVGSKAFALIATGQLPKGDCLSLAETAGILAAKKASDLIPLCHPLPLEKVELRCELNAASQTITVHCVVSTHAKTGVEMEALAGVQGALLTIYDLTKQVEPALTITAIRLNRKEGGKNGLWLHPEHRGENSLNKPATAETKLPRLSPSLPGQLNGLRVSVLTVSDRAAAGIYQDQSGSLLVKLLEAAGATLVHYKILPDEQEELALQLSSFAREGRSDLILTTGGTGLAQRDLTPEVFARIGERQVPGIGELIRSSGACFTPFAWLSRATAVTIAQTLLVALPGSPKAISESFEALTAVLPHAIKVLKQGQAKSIPISSIEKE